MAAMVDVGAVVSLFLMRCVFHAFVVVFLVMTVMIGSLLRAGIFY